MTTDASTIPTAATTETAAWWKADYPAQYYAFPSSTTLGGYPVAGLVDLNVYSSQPGWLTSGTTLVALTQAEWLSIVPVNIIIKDGKVQTYTPPATASTTTASGTTAAA